MARTPQVSRTFKVTEVTALCYDLDKNETLSVTRTLNKWYRDNKALLDKLTVVLIGDGLRPIRIERASKRIRTVMMLEEDFLEHAKVVDERVVDDEVPDYELPADAMIG